MRSSLILAMLGLMLGAIPARAQDIAAQPPYPAAERPAMRKAIVKPAPKPAAISPAAAVMVKLPQPRPASATPKPVETTAVAPKPVAQPAAKPAAQLASILPAPKTEAAPAKLPALAADPLASVPLDERAAIRSALLWSGAQDAGNGEDAISAAIRAYRKRSKGKASGELGDSERAELIAIARAHADEFGWHVVLDPATGVRIGLPEKLAPHAAEAKNGTRWSSTHGEIAIETFRLKTTDSLNALFEAQKREPAGRKIESSYVRSDSFFVSGLQGLRQFAVRAQLRNGELRGYTMFYDQAMEGIVLPVLPAMANAFAAFPGAEAPFAALGQPVNYGSGLIVSASGYIVTDRSFAEGCDVIAVPGLGDAERIAVDGDLGLALLRIYGKQNLNAAALTADGGPAAELRLIGVADPQTQNGGGSLSEVKAQLSDGNAVRLRESVPIAGFSGAAALDGRGRVLGLIKMRGATLASAGPAVAPVRLVPAAAIRGFLAAQKVDATDGDGSARASIVRVICVRK